MTQTTPQTSVQQLKDMRQSRSGDLLLLDVREPWEIDFASITGSVNIPMNLVPDRMDELPDNVEIVVMCHHGGRSQSVAQYLSHHGFSKISNLAGGINAWSLEIDPDVPQY